MSFYQSIASYYDRIFPLNQVALTFVAKHFEKGEAILDIGAGTGNMALALAEQGFNVTASEPDQEMVEWIRSKAEVNGTSISINTQTMQQIDLINGFFDGILCIGNTLPHLQNLTEIEDFIEKCFKKLNSEGRLILQLVNYDHVLSNNSFSFPVIEKDDFTFTRQYSIKDQTIHFTSKLTADGIENENAIKLYPVISNQLLSILNKIGFEKVQIYGNFKEESFTVDSKALIIVARKR